MELLGDRGATDDRVLLKHDDPQAGAGEIGRAGQSIVAAADEGDVVVVWHHGPACPVIWTEMQ